MKEGPDARDFEGREIDVSALAEWIWTDVPAAERTRIGGTGTGRRFRAALSLDEVWQREERRGEERGNGRRGWERGREREKERNDSRRLRLLDTQTNVSTGRHRQPLACLSHSQSHSLRNLSHSHSPILHSTLTYSQTHPTKPTVTRYSPTSHSSRQHLTYDWKTPRPHLVTTTLHSASVA